ncbi:hypothetical protein LCGC14_1267980 [marine sediment metagenome]|uniref:Uncharacterized protein n=1 Tax=marine sediment metagenome TaxID=412755 RepID=A0A0F9KYZ2_9ZZZZ
MDKKEENVQKALGTLDHFKCIKCGKVSYRNSLAVPIYEIIHEIGGPSFQECVGVTYKCSCGSEELKAL